MNYQKGRIQYNKRGYRRWDGYSWVYMIQTKCCKCKTPLFRRIQEVSKNKNFVCKFCKSQYIQEKRNPLLKNLIQKSNNNNYFYLLGLISSDGHITWPKCTKKCKTYGCEIQLHKNDKFLLEQIKKQYGGNLYYNHRNVVRWVLNSKTFINNLRKIGLTNNKSHTLNLNKWFLTLKPEHKTNFLRGFFDGDGMLYKTKKGYFVIGFICFSKSFINTLKDFLNKFKINFHIYKKERIDIFGKYGIKLLDLFYNNINVKNDLFLNRKYELYKELKNQFKNSKNSL